MARLLRTEVGEQEQEQEPGQAAAHPAAKPPPPRAGAREPLPTHTFNPIPQYLSERASEDWRKRSNMGVW